MGNTPFLLRNLVDTLHLLVIGLATYRIALLLVEEAGPFEVFGKLRHAVGVRYDAKSEQYATNELAKLFLCVWCMSIWVGVIITILLYFFPEFTKWVSAPLAFSALSILFHRYTNG